MAEQFISRGFKGLARDTDRALKERVPPGQYETKEFPVLSAGPTPRKPLERWDFSIKGEVAEELKWTWDKFWGLPRETVTVDIHCVTKWLRLDTIWTGVSVDTLLAGIDLDAQPALRYLIAFCDGGYTTNLPLAEVRGGKAWVVFVWNARDEKNDGSPLFLAAGGTGIAPLMSMIRHRVSAVNKVPTRLLYSSRSYEEVVYREELNRLSAHDPTLRVIHTLTSRRPRTGWVTGAGLTGRCWRTPPGGRRKNRSLSLAARPLLSRRSPHI